MLCITGTQRSGTTAAASLFKAEGYDLGSDLWDEVGGLENETICAFYRDYLGDPVFPFSNFPNLPEGHANHFALLDLPVVKFSMLCMNPAFVTIWSKFRPPEKGDRFLIMKRGIRAVTESKDAHREIFSQDSWLLNQDSGTMRANRAMSIRYLQDLGYPISVMHFE
ncbi:unnamed protein product, partial [marine sediment metagenome]